MPLTRAVVHKFATFSLFQTFGNALTCFFA